MRTPKPRGTRARRWSQSTPGRIAAAMMNPRKSRAMTTLIFQSAIARTTIEPATSVTTAARLAVMPIIRGFFPRLSNPAPPMLAPPDERVSLDARRHGVVLVKPLSRALAIAVLGVTAFALGWPLSLAGAGLLVVAALLAVVAVWKWDRTHVVLTTEKLFI